MPHEQTPAPPRLALPGYLRTAPPAEIQGLHREIEGLRMEREAMLNEEMSLLTVRESRAGGDDAARLRRRITELVGKAVRMNNKGLAPAPSAKPNEDKKTPPNPQTAVKPPTTSVAPSPSSASSAHSAQPLPSGPPAKQADASAKLLTTAPVDPLSLAQSLFLAGDHAAALQQYRQLQQDEQRTDARVTIQYMMACCLRKLGKTDEASMLYREVANSDGNDVLVENARWYLRAMKERRELEGQLDELRPRRQAVTPRKP